MTKDTSVLLENESKEGHRYLRRIHLKINISIEKKTMTLRVI